MAEDPLQTLDIGGEALAEEAARAGIEDRLAAGVQADDPPGDRRGHARRQQAAGEAAQRVLLGQQCGQLARARRSRSVEDAAGVDRHGWIDAEKAEQRPHRGRGLADQILEEQDLDTLAAEQIEEFRHRLGVERRLST